MFKHIVIGANAHAELSAVIRTIRPDLEVRGSKFTEVTEADLAWADAYIGFKRPPLPSMGHVRWVHCTGAGVDAWFHPVELDPTILLTRSSESFGPMIAEWALARALAFSQQIIELERQQRARNWAPRDFARFAGTRAVIVGTGDVGLHVARLFSALGCVVTGVSRTGVPRADAPLPDATLSEGGLTNASHGTGAAFHAMLPVAHLQDAVANADWIVITLPLTNATRGLFSRGVLARCNGAVLLNAGRGAVLDEAALPEALANGWISGAALDVFATEPLPHDSPLWADPRVLVSPHISGLTTTEGAAAAFLECLAELEHGRTPKWVVDRAVQY